MMEGLRLMAQLADCCMDPRPELSPTSSAVIMLHVGTYQLGRKQLWGQELAQRMSSTATYLSQWYVRPCPDEACNEFAFNVELMSRHRCGSWSSSPSSPRLSVSPVTTQCECT